MQRLGQCFCQREFDVITLLLIEKDEIVQILSNFSHGHKTVIENEPWAKHKVKPKHIEDFDEESLSNLMAKLT